MIRAISALVACIAIWLIGCAASQPMHSPQQGKLYSGKVNKNSSPVLAPSSGNENGRGHSVAILQGSVDARGIISVLQGEQRRSTSRMLGILAPRQ